MAILEHIKNSTLTRLYANDSSEGRSSNRGGHFGQKHMKISGHFGTYKRQ